MSSREYLELADKPPAVTQKPREAETPQAALSFFEASRSILKPPQSASLNAPRLFTEPEAAAEDIDLRLESAKIPPPPRDTIVEADATNNRETATISLESRFIGEAFKTYALFETERGILFLDKHAAHERVLYEKLNNSLKLGHRQILLSPVTVALTRDEHSAVLENQAAMESLGFLAEDFGGSCVAVRETPLELTEADTALTVRDIAAKLVNGAKSLTPESLERLKYSIACRAAIKAGDKTSPKELCELASALESEPGLARCPHGRPVTVMLSRQELAAMFGRS
jgi:DNA mismatch repair protein MutL